MNKKKLSLLAFVLITAMLGCTLPGGGTDQPAPSPTQAPVPTADYSLELPFEGVWTDEAGSVLVLTADRFYFKFMQGVEMDVVTENFAKILDYDLESGHLHIYMDSVLLNNDPGGFDYPQRYLIYSIQGDRLTIMFTDETYSEQYQEYEFTRY